MVGTFPDPPGSRIPYDRAGGACYVYNHALTALITQLTAAQLLELNDEDTGIAINLAEQHWVAVVFPEQYDLAGFLVAVINASTGGLPATMGPLQTSADSTNGVDGTWVERVPAPFPAVTGGLPSHTRQSTALAVAGVKAVRWSYHSGGSPTHTRYAALFGAPAGAALTASPNRLRLWHPTLNQPLAGVDLDMGDLKLGQTAAKTFRLRNHSGTLAATSISVTREVISEANPATLAEYSLSLDGTTWATSIAPPNIAAGGTSGVLHVRRAVGTGAQYTPIQARINATATFA